MPSTITTFYTFQPATKARSSQVNLNFSNYRGDILPVNENTSSASNNTHYLGAADHYWAGAYLGQVDFITSTTTATLVLKGDTSATLGAFLFQVEGATRFTFSNENGIRDSSYTAQITPRRLQYKIISSTLTANVTIPADVVGGGWIIASGGGGGGGGGSGVAVNISGNGGGGGAGAMPSEIFAPFAASTVLTVVRGRGGAGGAGGATAAGAGVSGSAGEPSTVSATGYSFYFPGAGGGVGGIHSGATAAGANHWGTTVAGVFSVANAGGFGQVRHTASASGMGGATVRVPVGISGGANSSGTSGGGGGGGSGWSISDTGKGGRGGDGVANGGSATGTSGEVPSTTTYGGGGGGGAGGGHNNGPGGPGGSGTGGAIIIAVVTAYDFSGTL